MRGDDLRTLAGSIEMGGLRREADCLLQGVRLLNIFTGEITRTNVALGGGRIVGIGDKYRRARETFTLRGRYLLPGFIEGHIHVESSLMTPEGFAEAVLPRGTTTVVADPHEIANVLGVGGVGYMLHASQGLPLDLYFLAPSCVPSTEWETSGASLGPAEIAKLLEDESVLGLAEVMDYPGVIRGKGELLEKILAARSRGKVVDGHAPGLSGEELIAYLNAGIGTDHECTMLEEAGEKLRLGMRIMIREGSQAKNMADLLPLVRPETARRFLLVSDDREAQDLLSEGHLDALRRITLLGRLGYYGDRDVLEEAATRFTRSLKDPASLHPDLRGVVYGHVAQEADEATYELLWDMESRATLQEEKVRLLTALTRPRKKDLLQKTLDRSLTSEVRSQDAVSVLVGVALNFPGLGRDLAWQFIEDHWDELYRRYSPSGFLIRRLAQVAEVFTTLERAQEVEGFFKRRSAPEVARAVAQSLEKIRVNAKWLERNGPDLRRWFAGRTGA